MPCYFCQNPKIFARGLCSSCYSRLRRRGTLARKNISNTGKCTAEGCNKTAFSKALCALHYQRARHPIRSSWQCLRSRSPGEYPIKWDSFASFLADVGERPSSNHQLRRPDQGKPWSKTNFVWRAPIEGSFKADQRLYARRWELRKKYNLTLEQFEEMLAAQNRSCAICELPFDQPHAETGKLPRICIDHDHTNLGDDRARGLLCDPCNKALGLFEDNLDRLRAAIVYLEKHSPN